MKQEELIRRYGKAAYENHLQQKRDRQAQQRERNPAKVAILNHETNRKGGKYYAAKLKYNITGIQGERAQIRTKHANLYRPYKQIIAPESQIHHEWIVGTPDYKGVALVETNQHQHGFIDVIQILEGKITLLTEAEIGGK